jgi:membrane-associated phospholipid phosphatase
MDRTILVALIAALAATLLLFALWPGIDIAVSRDFHASGHFLGRGSAAKAARDFFSMTPYALLIVMALAHLAFRWTGDIPFAPSARSVGFLVATLAIGPGLIVNLGMKDHLHRPRPVHVQEFGGEARFEPWYAFDGACAKNCSFASGEAAQGFWMVAPALLAPAEFQPIAIGLALAFGFGASVLRLAFGGHFLSDVIVGGLIALIVLVGLRRAFWPGGSAHLK